MEKKAKNKQALPRSSGLQEHQRIGKKLHPPLAQLPVKPFQWSIDVLPEMFLTDAVIHQQTWKYGPKTLHNIYDILDQFVPPGSQRILTGTISSLSLIPEEARASARDALIDAGLFSNLLPNSLCHGLALYPLCPAAWLLLDWREGRTVDWEQGISYMKDAVRRLWLSKSIYATRCRMFSVARLLKHGKFLFPDTPEITEVMDLFPRYPTLLTEDEQRRVEATSRSMFMALYQVEHNGKVHDWIPSFWRHNYDISVCEHRPDAENICVEKDQLQQLNEAMEAVVEGFTRIAQSATKMAKLDLYDVDRDEVLFGLLGRQYRLFKVLAENISLWTADVGTMFHRIMVDTLITLKWLIQQTNSSLFSQFKHFSLGKQKLLQLHVQDLVEQGREDLRHFEEEVTEEINEEIWEALLSIDLGGTFAGLDMRKMAHEVDLREMYNLVYSPASSELHGEWTSLKKFNLVRCSNPLHRFHRLPHFSSEHFLFPRAIVHAGHILSETLSIWLEAYHLQGFSDEIKDVVSNLECTFSQLEAAEETV